MDVFAEAYGNTDIVNGHCVTNEVTDAYDNFNSVRRELKLGAIVGTYQDLIPNVLCPWGCLEYTTKGGSLPFDAVIARFFPRMASAAHTFSTQSTLDKLDSARDDFWDGGICHLMNDSWEVKPSIRFDESRGPIFLSCADHNGGTREKYFHLPRQPFGIPASRGDSLSHVTLQARTIKPMKRRKFSTGYQLNECRGTYGGIHTCTVSERRSFDFLSTVTELHMSSALKGRADIPGLLSQLVSAQLVSADSAAAWCKRADTLFPSSVLLDQLARAGTMMSLSDCVKLQEALSLLRSISVRRQCGDPRSEMLTFIPGWPRCLVFVHPYNNFGAKFATLPTFTERRYSGDCRLLWLLSAVAVHVPVIWDELRDSVSTDSCWQGYFLSFVARVVLGVGSKGCSRNNPFSGTGVKISWLMDTFARWCSSTRR